MSEPENTAEQGQGRLVDIPEGTTEQESETVEEETTTEETEDSLFLEDGTDPYEAPIFPETDEPQQTESD